MINEILVTPAIVALKLASNDRAVLGYAVEAYLKDEAVRQKDLCRMVGVSRKTAYNCCKRLESRGLLLKKGAGWRLNLVSITDSFLELWSEIVSRANNADNANEKK